MAVLFDDFVASVLDRAKREGEISLPDVEAIFQADHSGRVPARSLVTLGQQLRGYALAFGR